ncbi:MAG TPA: peptidyl-prolyl cis-trans isomerase [Anaeromyxobacteraceae bacterium]|nr:peptidyl-prolyl cis-trans isomerase [Anaeromyxobacteraceae bacterium]
MVRRILPLVLAVAAVAACQGQRGPKKSGPAVARGDGVVITVDEFKSRLKEQSPIIRSRFTTLERKKEFLDGLVRFEVLAAEAERQGLYDDPDVQAAVRKLMVQKLVQRYFQDGQAGKDIPEAELRDYYEKNKAEYYRPARVRVAAISFLAAPGTPARAAKAAVARKAAAEVKAQLAKNPLAFGQLAQKYSEDDSTKAVGGDLGFKSQEDLAKAYGETFAAAVFGQKDGTVSGVLESSQGLHVVRVAGRQEELNRPFEQVKDQLGARLARERKQKELEGWVKGLKEKARVRVDEAALEKIAVDVEPGAGPMGGMPPGMHPGMQGGGMPPMMPGARPSPPGQLLAPAPAAPAK